MLKQCLWRNVNENIIGMQGSCQLHLLLWRKGAFTNDVIFLGGGQQKLTRVDFKERKTGKLAEKRWRHLWTLPNHIQMPLMVKNNINLLTNDYLLSLGRPIHISYVSLRMIVAQKIYVTISRICTRKIYVTISRICTRKIYVTISRICTRSP